MMNSRGYDKDGNRVAPYKEDSTRGASVLNPVNYKGDVLTQVWIDSRILATLTTWMEKSGTYPRFMSEIVREPLRVFVETLVEGGEIDWVENTVEARGLLNRRFRIDLSRGGRGGRNTLHNQILSEKRAELSDMIKGGSKFNDAQMPAGAVMKKSEGPKWVHLEDYPDYVYKEGDEEMKNDLIKKLKAKGIKSLAEKKEEALDSMKASGLIVKEENK